MVDVARQPVLAPRIPWRAISLAIVLIALLLARPPPCSSARSHDFRRRSVSRRTGLVAYRRGRRHLHGRSRDRHRDRDRLGSGDRCRSRTSRATERRSSSSERSRRPHAVQLYVVGADGTRPHAGDAGAGRLTVSLLGEPWRTTSSRPMAVRRSIAASDDRRTPASRSRRATAAASASSMSGMPPTSRPFRPPDGAEILFVGTQVAQRIGVASTRSTVDRGRPDDRRRPSPLDLPAPRGRRMGRRSPTGSMSGGPGR